MAKSEIHVPEIGTVFITKKRGQRTMRLRVDMKGAVQVSMPWIVPRSAAVDFIISKRDWIKEQQADRSLIPYSGMLFGKGLQLKIINNSQSQRAKQMGKTLSVPFEGLYDPNDTEHLHKIQKAITKALRNEAEAILLPRLRELAQLFGFEYKSSSIKLVTGRWGSCDSNKHISLSLFLIQLPIELIDYVLIHELAHTEHMNHSPHFWERVAKVCPEYKNLRQKMRLIQPRIYDAKTFMS